MKRSSLKIFSLVLCVIILMTLSQPVSVDAAGAYVTEINVGNAVEYAGNNTPPSVRVLGVRYGEGVVSTLIKGTHYDITCKNNDKVGTATVTITGKGKFSFTETRTYEIIPCDIGKLQVDFNGNQRGNPYTGKGIEKTLTIRHYSNTAGAGAVLIEGVDYILSYEDNINAGTATVIATGIGNYAGAVSRVYYIDKISIKSDNIEVSIPAVKHNSSNSYSVKPVITYKGMTLEEGKDYYYTVNTYTNVSNPYGLVTITGQGRNYKDTRTERFQILPEDQIPSEEPSNSDKPSITKELKRVAGNGRYDTMKAIVDEGFNKTGGVIVIATGENFKDALAASGLAGLDDAPIILTNGKALSSQAQALILKLKPRKVYIAGGTFAISDKCKNQIDSIAKVQSKRLAGQDSSSTSAKLAIEGKGRWKENTAIIATNKSFKDALSVSPIAYAKGYPVLLASDGKSLSNDVLNAISNIGIKQVIIVGGTSAVTTNVETQLRNAGVSIKIRLAGSNGVETSKIIAEWGIKNGLKANNMGIATSQNFPDALGGAALCGHNKSVLVLADDKAMLNASFPKNYTVSKVYIFGGESAVGKKTYNAVQSCLS